MAYIQTRRVELGHLITGTFAGLWSIKRELTVYFTVFLALGLISDFLPFDFGMTALLATIAYFPAQYWLYRSLLEKNGLVCDDAMKGFSFFFMAIILGLPIGFALQWFVVPGVLLAAKLIMAPTYLVAEETDLFGAIGGSWQASNNNVLALSLAFTALSVIWIALFFFVTALIGGVARRCKE